MLSFSDAIPRVLLKGQGILLSAIAAVILVVWVLNLLDLGFGPLPTIGLIAFAVCVALIVIETFARGTDRLGADGVVLAGFGAAGAALGYFLIQGSEFLTNYSHGIGVYVALLAVALLLGGGLMAMFSAPYGPRRPLPIGGAPGKVIGVVFALLLVLGSAFGVGNVETKTEYGWLFDERLDAIERASGEVPEDIQGEIDRLREEAGDDINKQIANAQEITNLINSVQSGNKIVHSGVSDGGPQLGWPALFLGVAAALVAIPSAGFLGASEQARWRASVVLAGLGLAMMTLTAALILSLVRVTEGVGVIAGVGAFMTFVAGFVIFATGRSTVAEFRRRKIYADIRSASGADLAVQDTVVAPERVLEGALSS